MLDMVGRCFKFSQTDFLILLHTSTLEQCYFIKKLASNKKSKLRNNLFPTKI